MMKTAAPSYVNKSILAKFLGPIGNKSMNPNWSNNNWISMPQYYFKTYKLRYLVNLNCNFSGGFCAHISMGVCKVCNLENPNSMNMYSDYLITRSELNHSTQSGNQIVSLVIKAWPAPNYFLWYSYHESDNLSIQTVSK
jgi:hypothetical protein